MRQRTRVVLFIERGNTLENHVVKEVVTPPIVSTTPVAFLKWIAVGIYLDYRTEIEALAVGNELRIMRSFTLNVLVEATKIDEKTFVELLDGFIKDIDPSLDVAIRRTKYLYVVIERKVSPE